jgi:hypothetical protein
MTTIELRSHETEGEDNVDIEEIKRRIAGLKNLPPDYFLAEQDQAARRLGFERYEHYRKSPLWRGIRKRILLRDSRVCQCCWVGKATEVHHRSYADDVMCGDNDALLASVCVACHRLIHFDGDKWRETREEREAIFEC